MWLPKSLHMSGSAPEAPWYMEMNPSARGCDAGNPRPFRDHDDHPVDAPAQDRPDTGGVDPQNPRSRGRGPLRWQYAAVALPGRERPGGQKDGRLVLPTSMERGRQPEISLGRTRPRNEPGAVQANARCGTTPRGPYPRGPGLDRPLHGWRRWNPNLGVVDLPGRAEHAAGSASTRRRDDADDPVS